MARGQNHRAGTGRWERSLSTVKRDAEAAKLRNEGWSYAAIAEHLGFRNGAAAGLAVKRALLDIVQEPASELRQLELARLDEALRVAFEVLRTKHLVVSHGLVVRARIVDPVTKKRVSVPLLDDAPRLQAIDRIVKIAERRAKLLGLDAPTQIQVLTMDVIDAEIARLTAELGAGAGGPTPSEAPAAP